MADLDRTELLTKSNARTRTSRLHPVQRIGAMLILAGILGLLAPPANASGTDRPIKVVLVGDLSLIHI